MQQNPLNRFFNNGNNNIPNQNNKNPMQMLNELNQFAKGIQNNPEQEVLNLLNSGQMSQEQFNQLTQIAKQVQGMLGLK